ncbi:response regulator transcription factor [Clostridium frigidicarnis]|uniref:Stage 0 sporulation protein A homolog n=1 Tax=Clostridium frigidicarnis TaxID=84698 RepID=A0A1I1AHW3_9CLOT|nr:response regulator transcription factor [Clostridium frigidicarnis]SFB35933.1 DNA-binding response regulator, OmpR family, contains REC and winged-helix (wHTH) domain [Clostridium frigidicarnis]
MNNKYKILVVDDEKDIREVIEIYLINEGYNVILAEDGEKAMEILKKEKIDLIVLDIMMPKINGIRLCKLLREKSMKIPVIMLSAKVEGYDKILGLNVGADDYVSKPFNPLELIARIKSQLRRFEYFKEDTNENKDEIIIEGLRININTREVFVEDKFIRLTPKEFNILAYLAANRGTVLTSEQIYDKVWKEEFYNDDNTVAVHIRNIRGKIEINPKEPRYIKLVWGVGYKIEK